MKRCLGPATDPARRRVRAACDIAGAAMEVPPHEIEAPGRGRAEAAFARQVAMYLAHVGFRLKTPVVAACLGRDRSTVAHACHAIEDLREDADFDRFMESLSEAAARWDATEQALSATGARWRRRWARAA